MAIQDKATLDALILSLFPTGTGNISAADIRQYLDDILDSNILQSFTAVTDSGSVIALSSSDIDQNAPRLPTNATSTVYQLPQVSTIKEGVALIIINKAVLPRNISLFAGDTAAGLLGIDKPGVWRVVADPVNDSWLSTFQLFDDIIELLDTSETDANKILNPDGSGGVEWLNENPVKVTSKSDLPTPSGGVITLAVDAYEISGAVDLGTDVLNVPAGAVITGFSTALSSITTNSANPLITHDSVGSIIITGGILLDNLGGPIFRMNNPVALLFLNLVVTRNATDFCIIDDALVVNFIGVTVGSPFSGTVQRLVTVNSSTDSIIFRGVAPILQDKGCVINAGVTIQRMEQIDMVNGTSAGEFINLDATSTINELIWGSSKVTVSAGPGLVLDGAIGMFSLNLGTITGSTDGMVISGTVTQLLSNVAVCIGLNGHGLDIRGSVIDRMFFSQHFLSSVAAGYGLIGDASSANIADIATLSDGSIAGALAPLNGIDPQDLKYRFKTNGDTTGGFVEDSRNISEVFLPVSVTGFSVTGSGAAFVQIGNNGGARPWTTQADDRFTVANDGTVTYIGLPPIQVEFSGTAIIEKTGGGADQVCAAVYRNNTTQLDNTIGCTRNSEETQVTLMGLSDGEIVTGDFFNVWVNNTTGAADVLVYGGNLIVKEVG